MPVECATPGEPVPRGRSGEEFVGHRCELLDRVPGGRLRDFASQRQADVPHIRRLRVLAVPARANNHLAVGMELPIACLMAVDLQDVRDDIDVVQPCEIGTAPRRHPVLNHREQLARRPLTPNRGEARTSQGGAHAPTEIGGMTLRAFAVVACLAAHGLGRSKGAVAEGLLCRRHDDAGSQESDADDGCPHRTLRGGSPTHAHLRQSQESTPAGGPQG